MKKVFWMVFPLIIFSACHRGKESAGEIIANQVIEMNIFYTDDILGEIDLCGCPGHPMGGIARRARFIQRFFEMKEPVLQLDAGELFFPYRPSKFPPSEQDKKRAEVLAKSYAKLKVDAVNVGFGDILTGVEYLLELKKIAGEKGELNFISSNLFNSYTGKPVFATEKIVERNGIKFGIFGLMRPGEDVPPNLIIRNPKETAEAELKKLREKVDIVIALLNLGYDESKRLCQEINGMDIALISGNQHILWTPELVNKTLLIQAGSGGKYLGQLKIKFYPGEKTKYIEGELKRIDAELKRISKEMKGLEKNFKKDKNARARYDALTRKKINLEQRRQKITSLSFDYQYVLVPMEANLLLDNEINEWVRNAR